MFSDSAAFLSDDELRAAQIAIAVNPRAGAAISRTHGARKLRVRNNAGLEALAALVRDVKESPCLENPAAL